MMKSILTRTAFLTTLIISCEALACSSFFHNGEKKIFGKNFDWSSGNGYIIKNNRGQEKYSYGIKGNNPAHWISKYGSITFNQIGKENPYGGMNETGLIVEQLWLNSSHYQDNNNSTISELEWIQYQLDNYCSVAEIIENIHHLTIKPTKATVHYFVADKDGRSAVIDFEKGRTVISKTKEDFQVLTNSTYTESLRYHSLFGTNINPDSRSSEDRFCQLTNGISGKRNIEIQEAFALLNLSAEDKENYKTYWTIVYNVNKREIHYKSYNNTSLKTIRMDDFSFNKNEQIFASQINTDTLNFLPYTFEQNLSLLDSSILMMGLKLDKNLANEHQINPSRKRTDHIYQSNYIELEITFNVKKKKGLLFYTFTQGEENFNRRRGIYAVMVPVSDNKITKRIYAFPKGEYAIAAFHDMNGDYKLDKGLFGIPKAYAFSNNAKGLFGLPPKYKKAKLDLLNDSEISISIK